MKNQFFGTFQKNNQILNFMKILPLDAEYFHVNRLTDTAKIIVAFSDFAKKTNTKRQDDQLYQ